MVRWKQQAMKIMAGSVLATAAVTGCSGGVSERIKEVVGEAAGEFRGDRPRTVLVIQTGGAASPARLLADAEPVLAETAREGGAVRVLVLSSGSAASMTEVRLPRGGDFTPVGRNQAAWTKEAQDYADAADREVDAALQRAAGNSPTGADLVGAVTRGVAVAREMPGDDDAPRQVVLVTGGGVHRTARLDLVAENVTPSTASALAARAGSIDPGEVTVALMGVGRFDGVVPPVDPVFADGVRAFWERVCSTSCHITAS